MQRTVKFYRPFIPESFPSYAKDIIDSGMLTQGKYLETFEAEIKDITGAKYCLCVDSGTAALHIAASIIEDKKAYISAYGFPAAFNAFLLAGKEVVPVDCSLLDYNIELSNLYNAMGYDDGVIVIIHQFGYPANIPIRTSNIIIEDAACALFTEVKGKHLGTLGDIGILSFHPRKIITTGEGGALLFNDEQLYLKAKAFHNHGIDSPGLNYRMPELSAALGLAQLNVRKYIIQQRLSLYKQYIERLSGNQNIILPEYNKPFCPQSFAVRISKVKTETDRNNFLKKLLEDGVDCRFSSKSAINLNYLPHDTLINTKILANECISLPFYTELQMSDVDRVCDVVIRRANDI